MSNEVDTDKIEKVITQLHKIINKANMSVSEILIAYGNLGYHLGAAMAGFKEQGPDLKTLQFHYYKDPTIDLALMLQGLTVTSWEEDFQKQPRFSKLGEKFHEQQPSTNSQQEKK